MPLEYKCHECDEVLYRGDLKAPGKIRETYDGKCPKCGRRLSSRPVSSEVKPTPEEFETVDPSNIIKKHQPKETVDKTAELLKELRKDLENKGEVVPSELLDEEPAQIGANFLNTFRSGINALIERFGLYHVSEKIGHVGGWKTTSHDGIVGLRLSLDRDRIYQGSLNVVSIDLRKGKASYLKREEVWNHRREVEPEDVPLEKRVEYQEKLVEKLERLSKALEHTK